MLRKGEIDAEPRFDAVLTKIAARFGVSDVTALKYWRIHMKREAIRTAQVAS